MPAQQRNLDGRLKEEERDARGRRREPGAHRDGGDRHTNAPVTTRPMDAHRRHAADGYRKILWIPIDEGPLGAADSHRHATSTR
jgi:hypothetical protein